MRSKHVPGTRILSYVKKDDNRHSDAVTTTANKTRKNKRFFFFTQFTLLSLVIQLVPLQLFRDGNSSVDQENANHADEFRLLLR